MQTGRRAHAEIAVELQRRTSPVRKVVARRLSGVIIGRLWGRICGVESDLRVLVGRQRGTMVTWSPMCVSDGGVAINNVQTNPSSRCTTPIYGF